MHKAFPLPVMKFPLPEEVPTASEKSSHCQEKRDATAEKIALLLKLSSNCQSKSYDSYAKVGLVSVGNKMHKAFQLPVMEFPLPEEKRSHCCEDCTATKVKKKLSVKVIEFGDSYEAPKDSVTIGSASDGTDKKKGRTHKTAQELWAAILKTFGGNEATKKTKKNLLKQQYGNFKAEGSETLEQTFNRLQVIVSHLEFMDIEIEHDDLNQKFLTSLPLEWLMYTIVWRNRSDLDTMTKHSSGNEEVNTASVSTASTNVSTVSANIKAGSISQDTACAYIAFQSNDVAEFDKSKVECFNCHKMGHFARECKALRSQDRGRRDNYKQGSKVEEQTPKALMEIDGVGWDWSYMANDEENHALVADEEAPTEFALMAKTSAKRLSQVEARLAEHRNQEVKYYKKIRVLDFKVESRANCIESLTKELELIKKEKKGL
nr:hypothetical protein [Tanacetum cinerariifolium]